MPSTLQFSFNAAYDEGALLSIFNIKPAVSQRKGRGWQLRQGEMVSKNLILLCLPAV